MQGQSEKIQVLIADKSGYGRLILKDIFSSEEDLTVAGLASDETELVNLLSCKKTDVAVLDADLLLTKGESILKKSMKEVRVPVLLLTPKERLSLNFIQEVNELGVYAILAKPGTGHYMNYRPVSDELLSKLRAAKEVKHWEEQERLKHLQQQLLQVPKTVVLKRNLTADTVFIIGASTGGTQAIEFIIRELAPELKATILIVVHLPQNFTHTFTRRLQEITKLRVVEGRTGLMLRPGKVIIAPGGRNMIVQSVMGDPTNIRICFTEEEISSLEQPSIDLLMKSVAKSSVRNVVGIILTGMGKDGTEGAASIRQRGGYVIAQDKSSSAIFGMAKAAIERGLTNQVLSLAEIPHFINNYQAQQLTVSAAGEEV